MTPSLQLISFDLCPYVQRAAIVLLEKGVAFERVDIDLYAKPDWFLALSPLGRVPVLRVGEEVLFESAVIAEYLEETQAPRLHPADPLEKAKHRAWIEFAATMLDDTWVIETGKDAAAFDARCATLRQKFQRIEALPPRLPFFAGEDFSIVDAAFAPVFRYFDTFDRMAPLGVLDGLPRVAAWRQALAARPSVRKVVVPDYPERLRAFIMKQGGVLAQRAAAAG
ncbi:glutathione S-transferase family protein [Falsiroseomonas bella]|uniref:glutathione transferase n=1 Tax=Falsiroseomonas bella TaxID=2184016 RepID=A0A317F9Q6_9PROT|nr:glutathione S-transferase family protein [Falsiroseomonas bella]PWS35784.1 glutathione S-transferase family protein [Falsiroseomonas bella]